MGNTIAIRQIDDLLLLTDSHEVKQNIKNCYTEGLELEEEQILQENGEYKIKFIGLDIKIRKGNLNVKVNNDNAKYLEANRVQKKTRFPRWEDWRPKSIFKNIILNELNRIKNFSIGHSSIVESIRDISYELNSLGWPKRLIISGIKGFTKRKIESTKRRSWFIGLKLVNRMSL